MITAFFVFLFLFIQRYTASATSAFYSLYDWGILYFFSLPFTTHGVEDTASLIDWHLSFSLCFLNVFFFVSSPPLSHLSGLWTSLYVSHRRPVRGDIGQTLYFDTLSLFGRVYQAGTYFVGNQHAKGVYDKLWHWESH